MLHAEILLRYYMLHAKILLRYYMLHAKKLLTLLASRHQRAVKQHKRKLCLIHTLLLLTDFCMPPPFSMKDIYKQNSLLNHILLYFKTIRNYTACISDTLLLNCMP